MKLAKILFPKLIKRLEKELDEKSRKATYWESHNFGERRPSVYGKVVE